MTDNEIIKALECCKRPANQTSCDDCPYQFSNEKCSSKLIDDALDLINRQKAEIERLNIVKKEYQELYDELKTENEKLKSSIKEVNEHLSEGDFVNGIALIIRLVKEMAVEE